MFKKILIANRGEIASRIIRACRRLNIESVAVYSEADQQAPFVKEADHARLLGGPRVNESYLNAAKIIEIAKEEGAEAIHPGYGFLSESGPFARLCKEEGIVFIGPSASVIEAMGIKTKARKIMEEAGVPVVPGLSDAAVSVEDALSAAEQIGYPVMLKASAGGGGIGMQRVNDAAELEKAFSGNQKRAESFFGNGEMFVEKLVENARHIEIQVLADRHGNAVYLGERECSIQRRNQKVVEEAPSPFVDGELRRNMGESAIRAVKKLGYENAGTLEFLVDSEKNYYFLEMNTRLQVEHPVTEEVTGIDIVTEQIRIAYGEELSIRQKDVTIIGHSIEVRIYAEDPVTFYPSPGQITRLSFSEGPRIRHEMGIDGQSLVSPFYDPMLAKLIVTGADRYDAIMGLADALRAYKIEGIKTNIPLLQDIINHEAFKNGDMNTSFIDTHLKKQRKG
ncbi:biotin carboxylase [Pradoshia eiseniae]|uniref:biotin carboxylase n=1 Tax=Pradoshia eiseniae TaxID=2064768 RepID=A0A2S7MX45_9BACI|nr:acetyl-CoA carboxylase biotin carboxylase subunit [Pradoshia eiseniae]PQD94336.1 biotin carboxylase [Pradoshia eiseniae]